MLGINRVEIAQPKLINNELERNSKDLVTRSVILNPVNKSIALYKAIRLKECSNDIAQKVKAFQFLPPPFL